MGLFNIFKQTLAMKNEEKMRIGLSQFKPTQREELSPVECTIRRKDVKLSDLMRRTNTY